MPKITKEFRINQIKQKLSECYQCEDNKENIFITLIDELAFQIFTLQDCKEKILQDGYMVLFQQGKQEMWIVNPLQKVYDQTVKNLNTTIKSLESIGSKRKKDSDEEPDKSLSEFLNMAKKIKGE